MSKLKKTILCAIAGIMLIAALTGCSALQTASLPGTEKGDAAAETEQVPEITVCATGTVRLVPDKATVSFGVTTEEKTAELAQKNNSIAVEKVIQVLVDRGIEEKSIRTDRYSMYPEYDYSSERGQRLIGYNVTTSMTVQDQDIEEIGKLLSACVEAGINDIDSVTFLCSGYDEAYQQALADAVKTTREKAEALASAAGKTLGEAVTISEGWQDLSARYGQAAEIPTDKEAFSNEAVPSFQPGETEITANVTVVYKMN